MLVEEWEMYANKDLSEQEKAYQQRLEHFILENCHSYWKNHISIIKAAIMQKKEIVKLMMQLNHYKKG